MRESERFSTSRQEVKKQPEESELMVHLSRLELMVESVLQTRNPPTQALRLMGAAGKVQDQRQHPPDN